MKSILFLILLLPYLAFTQIGKSGGLFISKIVDSSGVEIDTNMRYTLNAFLLGDTILATKNVYSSYNLLTKDTVYKDTFVWSTEYDYIRQKEVPQYNTFLTPVPREGYKLQSLKHFKGNFRISIQSESDTMVVDFINTIGFNVLCVKAELDTLQFKRGYIQYKKANLQGFDAINDTSWIITTADVVDLGSLLQSKEKSIDKFIEKAYKKQRRLWRKNSRIYEREKRRKKKAENKSNRSPKTP